MTTNFPHDVFGKNDDCITPNRWRFPRVVVLDQVDFRQWAFSELNDMGITQDTTLTGVVLNQIEQQVRLGTPCGELLVDGIPYQYVSTRLKLSQD